MLFSTPFFCFIFLPVFFAVFYLAPGKRGVLLAAGLTFYFWGEPVFCLVVAAASLLDWALGKWIDRSVGWRRQIPLVIGVAANLGLLIITKYAFFAVSNLNFLLDLVSQPLLETPKIALPLGISFIVFEKITYLVDIYRGNARPASSLLDYFNYVFLFPKLLAGPIVKYHDIGEQLKRPYFSTVDFREGMMRFIIGLGKKVLIADQIGVFADRIFEVDPVNLDMGTAWLGLLAFGLQLYFDFSGYSDMAIGMARMMGFRLQENFNNPYLACSISEFWKRWHISLTSWIKEYLYIPLGGNRLPAWRVYLNLSICFALSGLWHGASWTFVIWGILHGAGMIADRLLWYRVNSGIPMVLRWAGTNIFLLMSWSLFRVPDLASSLVYLGAAFGRRPEGGHAVFVTADILFFLTVALLIVFVPLIPRRTCAGLDSAASGWRILRMAWCAVVLIISAAFMSIGNLQPFIYFNF